MYSAANKRQYDTRQAAQVYQSIIPGETDIVRLWYFARADIIMMIPLIEFNLKHIVDSSETDSEVLCPHFDVLLLGKSHRVFVA